MVKIPSVKRNTVQNSTVKITTVEIPSAWCYLTKCKIHLLQICISEYQTCSRILIQIQDHDLDQDPLICDLDPFFFGGDLKRI